MPVTITLNRLAIETRVHVDSATPPPEPYNTLLTRQLSVATKMVEKYAEDAPDDVLDEAVVRLVGYWVDAPFNPRTPQNAFIHSGAKAMLSQWREITSAQVV